MKAPLPLMVAYGEIDPQPFIEQSKLLNMSEVYAINTEDRSLSGPVLEFAGAGR